MKYILPLILLLSSLHTTFAVPEDCKYDPDSTVSLSEQLAKCKPDGSAGADIVAGTPSTAGIAGIKATIIDIAENAIQIGGLIAVGMIVWAGFTWTTVFEDEKRATNAKMTVIYALLGLLILMVTFPFVNIIISFIFSLVPTA
jgi:intracellular septation protein A